MLTVNNMTKKKKTIIGAISTAVAVAIAATAIGSFAFFQDAEKVNTNATAGAVDLAEEQIDINSVQLSIVGNGYTFNMGTWAPNKSSNALDGWASEGNTTTTKTDVPVVFYYMVHASNDCPGPHDGTVHEIKNVGSGYECEYCGATWSTYEEAKADGLKRARAYPNFFRTSDGKVAYCVDNGKTEPTNGQINMSAEMDEKIKRVLAAGYPSKNGEDYGLTSEDDWKVEYATTLALYVVENKKYNSDGDPNGYPLNEDYIRTYYSYVNDSGKPSNNIDECTNARQIIEIMNKIITAVENGPEIKTFTLKANGIDVKAVDSAYIIGPYIVDSNDDTIVNLSCDNNVIKFLGSRDVNDSIMNVNSNTEFFVWVPTTLNSDITITAEAPIDVVPNYYFWSGNKAEQRMVVASTAPAKVSANISTIKEIMPGDVVDVSWTVQNNQNKAVVTRNRVFIWWDDAKNSNAIENTFILKGNADNAAIQQDMLDGVIDNADLLFTDSGPVREFTLDDGTTHTGYSFTIMGDWLDGVGSDSAEIIRPDNGDHYGNGEGEVDYNSSYDETDPAKDVVSFKIGFGQDANINTSGQRLRMQVITEAIQWQNTTDAEYDNLDWTVIGRTSY